MTLAVDSKPDSTRTDNEVDVKRTFNSNSVVALIALGLGVVLLWVSREDAKSGGNIIAAESTVDLPLLLLSVWIGLSAIVLIQSVVEARRGRSAEVLGEQGLVRLLPAVALVTAIAAGTVFVGYLIPVAIGLPMLLWLLGEHRPAHFIGAYLILGPGLWLLFHHILEIRLPSLLPGGLF